MKSSIELLEENLRAWCAIYGRKPTMEAIDQWKVIFTESDPSILAEALQMVTTDAERMPTPGMLTKAILLVCDKRHLPRVSKANPACNKCNGTGFRTISKSDPNLPYVPRFAQACECAGIARPSAFKTHRAVGKDDETGKSVNILIDEGTGEHLFRATDCKEGRAFLNKLREVSSK